VVRGGDRFPALAEKRGASRLSPVSPGFPGFRPRFPPVSVPGFPGFQVNLGTAWLAWTRILYDMVEKHMDVGDAVTETNQNYLPTSQQYQVIGDGTVKIN
jgi:hypothetical protein